MMIRHLWDSLKNLKRNGWMTVAAVSSVTITLILVAIFLSFIMNTAKLARDLEGNVRVTVYMKLEVHDQDQQIQDPNNATKKIPNPNFQQVQKAIQAVPNVKTVTFSSKDTQLADLKKQMGASWNLYSGDANPLYDAYIVEATAPAHVKQVAADVGKLNGVYQANYGGADANKIFAVSNTVQTYGIIGAALLLFVAVFLISNTIRMTILSRSREIQIMRLVGATNGYIRWPFFLEGAWVGLIGAIIPSALVFFFYPPLYTGLEPSLARNQLHLLTSQTFVPQVLILLFATGIIIGSLGSLMSMRRFLKI